MKGGDVELWIGNPCPEDIFGWEIVILTKSWVCFLTRDNRPGMIESSQKGTQLVHMFPSIFYLEGGIPCPYMVCNL